MTQAHRTSRTLRHAALLGVLLASPLPADSPGQGTAPADPDWQEECGSCHSAYPPRFLPPDSWRRTMSSLADHFGTDASLEPARAASIETYLVTNARKPRSGESGGNAPLRITETRWFEGEHDEISATKWRSPAVGSAANCGACHARADQGHFGERDIRIP